MTGKTIAATSYSASAGAVFVGLTMNELAALVGIVVAVGTFIVNFLFQWRRDKREQALVDKQIKP